MKIVCTQAAREGHRWNKNIATLCTRWCLQIVFSMSGHRRSQSAAADFDHRFASRATSNQLPYCWYLPNLWIIVSQVLRGRRVVWRPSQVENTMQANQQKKHILPVLEREISVWRKGKPWAHPMPAAKFLYSSLPLEKWPSRPSTSCVPMQDALHPAIFIN